MTGLEKITLKKEIIVDGNVERCQTWGGLGRWVSTLIKTLVNKEKYKL